MFVRIYALCRSSFLVCIDGTMSISVLAFRCVVSSLIIYILCREFHLIKHGHFVRGFIHGNLIFNLLSTTLARHGADENVKCGSADVRCRIRNPYG